jgi:hypothetical protein
MNNFGVEIDTTVTGFKLQARRFFLTYPTHINKEELVEWFSREFYDLKFFGVAHETGDTGYNHTHFLVNTVKQPNIQNANKFDYQGNHPNIKKILTEAHWKHCFNYLHKQDTNVYTNIKIEDLDKQTKCNNLIKAIEKCKSWGEVLRHPEIGHEIRWCRQWAKDIFDSKPKSAPKCNIKFGDLFKWQKDLYNQLKNNPEDRQIIWTWGNPSEGKSTFTKYLENKRSVLNIKHIDTIDSVGFVYNGEDIIVIDLDWTKSKRLEQELMEFYSNSEEHNRTKLSKTYDTLLSVIETLSDHGSYTSPKYEGKHVVFDCHILVMSNCNPENVRKHLPNRLFPIRTVPINK